MVERFCVVAVTLGVTKNCREDERKRQKGPCFLSQKDISALAL